MNLTKELPIPFPVLVTNGQQLIIDFNEYFKGTELPTVQKGQPLIDYFDQWVPSGDFHIAYYNDHKYLLVSKTYEHHEQKHYMYILLNGEHYVDLLKLMWIRLY